MFKGIIVKFILIHINSILVSFLSFKGTTDAYKKPIAHNKYLFPLLYLLSDCISAESVPQILSLNDEQTFLFLNFVIIGL